MERSSPAAVSFFRNRFVQVIMISGILLQIGIWVRNFAILLFVMEKTHNDAFAVSMVSWALFFLGMIITAKLFNKENKLIAGGE